MLDHVIAHQFYSDSVPASCCLASFSPFTMPAKSKKSIKKASGSSVPIENEESNRRITRNRITIDLFDLKSKLYRHILFTKCNQIFNTEVKKEKAK